MSDTVVQNILVELIDPDPENPRRTHDSGPLHRLAETIKARGVEQPIRVRRNGKRFIVVFGERRWHATQLAGLKSIPCIIEEITEGSEQSLRIRRLLENCARENLATVELADAIELAIAKDGITAAEVARQTGLSESHISKLRLIGKASDDIRQAVQRGSLPIAAAYELAKAGDDSSRQVAAAGSGPATRLSQVGLARKLKRVRRTEEGARSLSRITAMVGGGRSIILTGKPLSLDSMIDTVELFLSRARKAKAQGLTLATFVRTLRDQESARARPAEPHPAIA